MLYYFSLTVYYAVTVVSCNLHLIILYKSSLLPLLLKQIHFKINFKSNLIKRKETIKEHCTLLNSNGISKDVELTNDRQT